MLKKVLCSGALALTLFGSSGTAITAVNANVVTTQDKNNSECGCSNVSHRSLRFWGTWNIKTEKCGRTENKTQESLI